ncbi:MAG: hypothetical protein KGY80_13005, partial [Candidatus Thorarchaeota archaeon]|nr:hypothetical protein [Candidatus Thorarchaeota archaeon]
GDVGIYNYTLAVYDGSGNRASDSVVVTVVDTTPPAIDSLDDIEYDLGTTGHSITWTPSDLAPNSYTLLRNGTEIDSSAWDGTSITVDIDELELGAYNYTLVVQDESSNTASDTVFVTVVDTTPPTIDSPADIEYELGTTGHTIAWHPSDADPESYQILKNGSLLYSSTGIASEINISVDGLAIGAYNYTLVVYDGSGNSASDTVIVTVVDSTPPVIGSPADVEYELGSTEHNITWSGSDEHPESYELLRNGTAIDSGDWSGSEIVQSIDDLAVGVYNYTLVLIDEYDNTATDTVMVTVVDTTPPSIDRPDDIEYEVGTTGHDITWAPSDLDPESYTVYMNDTLAYSGTWNGSEITTSVDGLGLGTYSFRLVVEDGSGNTASDTVLVTVVQTAPTTTTTTTDETPPSGQFPMLLLAIGGGIAAVVVVLVIVFLKRKEG